MKRIQRKRTKGWRMPENAVYVGRGTKWGNPFVVGKLPHEYKLFNNSGTPFVLAPSVDWHKPLTLEKSIEYYRGYIQGFVRHGRLDIEELRGKDLACWCPLDKPCHADVLIELLEGK